MAAATGPMGFLTVPYSPWRERAASFSSHLPPKMTLSDERSRTCSSVALHNACHCTMKRQAKPCKVSIALAISKNRIAKAAGTRAAACARATCGGTPLRPARSCQQQRATAQGSDKHPHTVSFSCRQHARYCVCKNCLRPHAIAQWTKQSDRQKANALRASAIADKCATAHASAASGNPPQRSHEQSGA